MRTPRSWISLICLAALCWCAPAGAGELPERLTLDWIHSDAAREIGRNPSYSFAGDLLMRYDTTLPVEERTIELLDPSTGGVALRVDRDRALASLAEVSGQKPDEDGEDAEDPEELGRPRSLSADGRLGLYQRQGDLYVLDLAASSFRRLTTDGEPRGGARFSPDASMISFLRDNDLYVLDVADGAERRLTHDGSETILNGTLSWVYWEELFGRRDRGHSFSPTSSRIAFFQFDDSPVDVMTFVDPSPNRTRVIRQRYPKAGTDNPKVRAGVIDLASGKTTWIDLGSYPYEYLARLVWLPDGERLIVQAMDREQRNLDLFLADAATGEVEHLFRDRDEAWIDVGDDLVFLDDGERFLWVSGRDGHTHLYLYELTAPGARLLRRLTDGDWSLTGGARRADGLGGAIATVDEDNARVYFMARKDSYLESHLYRVGLDGTGLTRVTTLPGSHRTTWSRSGEHYIDSHSSFDRPPATDLYARAGEKLRDLTRSSTEIADHFGFSLPERVTFTTDDGFEHTALLLKPSDFDPSRQYPVIVRVYGGPAAPRVSDRWYGSLTDQLLTRKGYVLFTVDPRTSTARGKPVTRALVRDFYGEREAADIVAGVRWLKERDFVDPDRFGVTGWSGGGTTTVSVMTRSDEFRAGIAGAGVYNWELYDTIYTERYMKHPAENREGYERNNLARRAADLHGRLLLFHGSYDDNVHPQNTWQLVDALIDAGIPYDLGIYPMRKHGFRDDEARLHSARVRFEFWHRELGGESWEPAP